MATGTWISSIKILLISIGSVSLATRIKFFSPFIVRFVLDEVSLIWFIVLSLLKPPYLYVTVNGIILAIIFSLRNHVVTSESNPSIPPEHSGSAVLLGTPPPSASDVDAFPDRPEIVAVVEPPLLIGDSSEERILEVRPVFVNGVKVSPGNDEEIDAESDKLHLSSSAYNPPKRIISPEVRSGFLLPATEEPLVSSQFSNQKPNYRKNPEDKKRPRLTKSKSTHRTLESTWKMITEGRQPSPERDLKSCDTLERQSNQITVNSPYFMMPKSKTFRERTDREFSLGGASINECSINTKITKELSPDQDELNRRVEAFIKKFNEEMRLQRQESIEKYLQMINGGT